MVSSLHSRSYGSLASGESVAAWRFEGKGGLIIEALTYGGTVKNLLVPDREGRLRDVVLGFDELRDYVNGGAYFGAITGRVAGRTTGARFTLDGRSYELARNDAPNHLHGGVRGFDKRVWMARREEREDGAPSLSSSYISPDGEEGYPGNVTVNVTYTVTDDNVFLIETTADTDKPTPFSLTHHSYFNLAGEQSGSIADHELQIHSSNLVAVDEQMALLGYLQKVDNTAADFRTPKLLGPAIPELFKSHGDLYVLDRRLGPAARLSHPESGRVMTVTTSESFLQLYTGAALNGFLRGKSGTPYVRHAGVCLECEGYPDGANTAAFGDFILRPGVPLHRTTAYAFSVEGGSRG